MNTRLYTEKEVIERERAAFFNGAVYGEIASDLQHFSADDFPRRAHDEAARRYPLPLKVPA